MLKRCILLLALSSCGSEENKPIKLQLDSDGNIHMDSKVRCNTRFKWVAPSFQNKIYTDEIWSPRIRSRSDIGLRVTGFSNHDENELSIEQKKVCEEIYNRLSGEGSTKQIYRVQQWFNRDDIKTLTDSTNNQPVELRTESFVIINEFFKNSYGREVQLSNNPVTLSAAVSCENKWTAKIERVGQISLTPPEGQCKFYLNNYIINLPSGPKFVEISGYYAKSNSYEDVVDVVIESYGF